jgi:hypothetical protein
LGPILTPRKVAKDCAFAEIVKHKNATKRVEITVFFIMIKFN